VSFYAQTTTVRTTWVSIRVVVEAQRFGSDAQSVRVTEAEVVYVAINQYREKVKIGK
jgi:acyl-CoA hydrolase